jgi:hypothetical protein
MTQKLPLGWMFSPFGVARQSGGEETKLVAREHQPLLSVVRGLVPVNFTDNFAKYILFYTLLRFSVFYP